VPALWDKGRNEIMSSESSEIIRVMNSAFDSVGAGLGDFYLPSKQPRQWLDGYKIVSAPDVATGIGWVCGNLQFARGRELVASLNKGQLSGKDRTSLS
jgi:glutathionyl-hydroquinone reductase